MTGRTHDVAAFAALSMVAIMQPLPPMSLSTVIVAVLANQLGGIVPDIDQPAAPFWRNLPIGGYVGKIISRMLGGHRFLTHSVIGLVLVGFVLHWFLLFLDPIMGQVNSEIVWWAFMIGMFSHLVMDTFTREGVPWLLPIPIKFGLPPVRKWRIVTGKRVETFVIFPLLIAFVVVFYLNNYQTIIQLLPRQ